jgi:DNA topoisomerase IB
MRLRRVVSTDPGIRRVRRGRGFGYVRDGGAPVRDPATLERIRGLAIPPAWQDVWICTDERGHLQAVGIDAAGRRQYLYHPQWRARRDVAKFGRMEDFAEALPAVRRRVTRHLHLPGMPRERALATAVRLLDDGAFRIGGEGYARRNGSFGLATIRKAHVEVHSSRVTFDYVAKGGVRRMHEVEDPDVVAPLRAMRDRRDGGRELLAYREDGRWHDVRSAEINAYLKDLAGDGFSAKDFRTWHATVLAAIEMARAAATTGASSPAAARRTIAATVKAVAEDLGNTPAVCRASYIDPRVFDRYREGRWIDPSWADRRIGPRNRRAVEREVLALIRGETGLLRAA